MSDLIERLRDKARLRAAHGLTGWVLAEEALLAQAADEIERLTAEQQHEAEQVPSLKRTIRDLCAERDELRRQLAEAEQDARRYRWLRENREFCVAAYPEGEWVIPAGMVFLGYSNPDADSWIDAARSLESSNE